MTSYPLDVVDEHGNVHVLRQPPLGEGGQGAVFATRDPSLVVKFLLEPDPADPTEKRLIAIEPHSDGRSRQHDLRERLEVVRTLPLPEDLNLARPLAMLRGHVGYTMQLMSGMKPIRGLIIDARSEDFVATYRDSGGLRRRLRVLARTALALGRLHALPLVYADMSFNNVFVSADIKASQAWLIDADNLHYATTPGPAVFTPGFGAPEIVTNRGEPSTLSDAYAFAVLAFWTLAGLHPFAGEALEEGGWDESRDMQAEADAGELPFVDDEDDTSNATDKGLPRDWVLTPKLRALFQRAFGPGRRDRTQRPGMLEWTELLHQCADLTVCCPVCASTFYAPVANCPWCEASPVAPMLYVHFHAFDPELDAEDGEAALGALAAEPVWRQCLDLDELGAIRRHAAFPSLFRDPDPDVLLIEPRRHSVRLTPAEGLEISAYFPSEGRRQSIVGETVLPAPVPGAEWTLHFGPLDRPHRVAMFQMIREDQP